MPLSPVRSFVWLVLLVQGVLEFPYLYLIKKVPTPPKSPVTVKEIILTQTNCFFTTYVFSFLLLS